jgi:WD40 repeat protein
MLAGFIFAVVCCLRTNLGAAGHRRHQRRRPTASPSATPTVALRPLVLISGGTGTVAAPTGEGPAVLNTAEVYDCVKGVFLPINSMSTARDRDAATILPNGMVLVAGGIDTAFAASIPFTGAAAPWLLLSTEMFDPAAGVFETGPRMTVSRDEPTTTLLSDGKVLIVGGGTSSAELFDPAADKFVVTGEMVESRYGQSATLLNNGNVLIAGGGAKRTELYDPRTGRFRPSAKLRSDRTYHTATMLPDGAVLIAGGSPYARSAAVDTTEIYDEVRRTVKAGPKMIETRAGHTATLLPDGRVLLAGGHNDNSAELYDGYRFVSASRMNASRYSHSATLLPDGKVLIAGGWDSQDKPLASAEIYDPSSGRFAPTSDMTEPRAGHTATLIWVHWPVDWIKPTATPTPTPSPTPTDATPIPTRATSPIASANRKATPAAPSS